VVQRRYVVDVAVTVDTVVVNPDAAATFALFLL
jgi:hypothetical protein